MFRMRKKIPYENLVRNGTVSVGMFPMESIFIRSVDGWKPIHTVLSTNCFYSTNRNSKHHSPHIISP